MQHIHRVLKQALGPVRWERIHRNSEDHIVRPPKVEKREMKVYDVPQTVNLIDMVRGKRVFIPVVLAAMCGLRRGEIAGLAVGRYRPRQGDAIGDPERRADPGGHPV